MAILNFGSLNLDYVYAVEHICAPGETITSSGLSLNPGGKGLNQSVSLARAGAEVYHAGMVGEDGAMLVEVCRESGVHTDYIKVSEERTGNAIIQVADSGENSIVLFAGANRKNTSERVDEVLAHFGQGDTILLQNEINLVDKIIEKAYAKGMKIALNPSPYDSRIDDCDLTKVSIFLLNEVEGFQITGEKEPDDILASMREKFPDAAIVLTLGSKGVAMCEKGEIYRQSSYRVEAVDTTAAGDTFTGYFLQAYTSGKAPQEALELASKASALAVTAKGAVPSIPWHQAVEEAVLEKRN